MPEPRPLVAIERQSGSVSEICLSGGEQCLFNRGQPFHFFVELRQLFLKPCLGKQHCFRRFFSCGSLAVGGIELAHVACHALLDLLLAALDLALREVVVTTVHGLELAAVDGNAGLRQQAHLAAQLDESRANLLDRGAIVLAESAMVL